MNFNKDLAFNNAWKELYKNVVDNGVYFNTNQKNCLKLLIELYFENRKNYIINYYNQINKKYYN